MSSRNGGLQHVALLATFALCSFYVSTVLEARSNDENSPKVRFVYYKVLNIPFAMDSPPRKNIYSVSNKKPEEQQLTKDDHSFYPVISPDGTHVAYIHVTADSCEGYLVPPKYEINVMNADGTDRRTVVGIDRPVQLFWSPDGKTIVYGGAVPVINQPSRGFLDLDTIRDMGNIDLSPHPLYQIDSNGDAPARLLAENATALFNQLEWSADGKWIAYICQSQEKANAPRFHVCLIGTGRQAELRTLTDGALFSERYSWSPDGTEMVYSVFDALADKAHKDAYRLFVVRTDGSPRLLATSKEPQTPRWSPDGKKILFCDREKDKRLIHVINADGSDKVRLTDPKLDASNPIWSPDGEELAFTAPVHGKLQVHLMSSDGSHFRVLTHDRKLSCSNITWLRNTRLLLLLCGQTVAPLGARFRPSVDGAYYLISADDQAGTPRQLAQRGAMGISFATEAHPNEQEPSTR